MEYGMIQDELTEMCSLHVTIEYLRRHLPCTVEHNINVSVLLQNSLYRCLVQHIKHLRCHPCVRRRWKWTVKIQCIAEYNINSNH